MEIQRLKDFQVDTLKEVKPCLHEVEHINVDVINLLHCTFFFSFIQVLPHLVFNSKLNF